MEEKKVIKRNGKSEGSKASPSSWKEAASYNTTGKGWNKA